ncbi:MAG: TetR/AcrR family transcriptional regulator [Clostridia bacterium]|nr:TetR/AcrR family transcriptional regulator [Clostridia bacterium]
MKTQNTKGKIVSAAWKLFYEQGYEETTIEDILFEAEVSRGTFYHYFESKDALLGSLSFLFDEKYVELEPELDKFDSEMEKLLFLNAELFNMIENTVAIELLVQLLSSQLVTKGDKHLLDRSRYYYKLLRKIFIAGQASGEFTEELSANELVKMYAITERSLMYDWCLCNGEYSLKSYSTRMMPYFMGKILKYKNI